MKRIANDRGHIKVPHYRFWCQKPKKVFEKLLFWGVSHIQDAAESLLVTTNKCVDVKQPLQMYVGDFSCSMFIIMLITNVLITEARLLVLWQDDKYIMFGMKWNINNEDLFVLLCRILLPNTNLFLVIVYNVVKSSDAGWT